MNRDLLDTLVLTFVQIDNVLHVSLCLLIRVDLESLGLLDVGWSWLLNC